MDSKSIAMKDHEGLEKMDDGTFERVSDPKALKWFTILSAIYLPLSTYITLGLIGYIPFSQGEKWTIWVQTAILVGVVRFAVPLRITAPVMLALILTALLFGPTSFVYFDAFISGTSTMDMDVLEFVTQDTREYLETHERF